MPASESRSICMQGIQRIVGAMISVLCYAFMVGEYLRGARLFTCPIQTRPPQTKVVRTPRERTQALAAGGGFAWGTLRALQGTKIEDAAARALLAAGAFAGPTKQPIARPR